MRNIIALVALLTLLCGCAVVTIPVKVAAKTVETAADIID